MNEIISKQKDQENLFLNTLRVLDKQYLNDNSYDLVEQQGKEEIDFKTSLGFFH